MKKCTLYFSSSDRKSESPENLNFQDFSIRQYTDRANYFFDKAEKFFFKTKFLITFVV